MPGGLPPGLPLDLCMACLAWGEPRQAKHVGVLGLERLESRIVGASEVQLCVRQAGGCELELCAILEHLRTVGEAANAARLERAAVVAFSRRP